MQIHLHGLFSSPKFWVWTREMLVSLANFKPVTQLANSLLISSGSLKVLAGVSCTLDSQSLFNKDNGEWSKVLLQAGSSVLGYSSVTCPELRQASNTVICKFRNLSQEPSEFFTHSLVSSSAGTENCCRPSFSTVSRGRGHEDQGDIILLSECLQLEKSWSSSLPWLYNKHLDSYQLCPLCWTEL